MTHTAGTADTAGTAGTAGTADTADTADTAETARRPGAGKAAGELPSGTTPALILSVLADGPLHGYGLAKEIGRRSGGYFTGSWGSLYPALQRLEQEGLIEGSWEPYPPQGKRRRRVYHLTAQGRNAAKQAAGRWRQFALQILQVIGQGEEPAQKRHGVAQTVR